MVDHLEDRRGGQMEGRWADPMAGLQEQRGEPGVLQQRPVSLQAPLQAVLLVPKHSGALTA